MKMKRPTIEIHDSEGNLHLRVPVDEINSWIKLQTSIGEGGDALGIYLAGGLRMRVTEGNPDPLATSIPAEYRQTAAERGIEL